MSSSKSLVVGRLVDQLVGSSVDFTKMAMKHILWWNKIFEKTQLVREERTNLRRKNVTKLNNSMCEKTKKKLKMWQQSKFQNMTKQFVH